MNLIKQLMKLNAEVIVKAMLKEQMEEFFSMSKDERYKFLNLLYDAFKDEFRNQFIKAMLLDIEARKEQIKVRVKNESIQRI